MSNVILVGQQAGADRATGEEIVAVLHEAVGVISSVCDYAQQLDARGFSAADAWLGHVLAQMSPRLWSDDVALTAWDMLRKYRGQLAAAGIDYDRLPRPAGAAELEAEQREQARGRARDHARQWREQDYRQKHSYVRCDGDGEDVILAFPYNPELVAGCRKIDGRGYDGATKANVFPFASLPAVISLAAAHGIEVTADVRALAAIATARAEEMAARPEIRLPDHAVFPQVTPGGEPVHDSVVIDTDYNPGLNEALKELNGGKSTWDHASGVHRLPLRCVTGLPEVAERYSLRIGADVSALITKVASELDRTRAAAGAFDAEPVPVPGLAAGMALKPQQYPVVRFAVDHRRVLVGDDMGWGKTASSLAAVAVDGAYPAVVVCRPSLTLNWAAEIRRFFPALAVHEASGTSPQPIPDGTGIVVIGSAALAATPRKKGRGGKEFGWVETLKKITPKALIIDEGQDTKERAANRSQACEQLAAAVIARNGLVLNLTGTAILNRPRELCQQLTILDRIDEFGGPKTFLWRYCLSETNEWGASYNGARNLAELHDRLRSWGIMIRRSDDAALGLPPCREHVLHIPIEHLDAAVMARYQEAEADLLGFLAEKARQTAERLGKDPASAAVEAAMRASAAEHLVAINTLRQLAGQAKRGYVTAWVREHVQAGEKVMVAAHHREEVDAYAAAFGGLKLQGGQPVAEKEAVKARFQQRPAADAPVIAVAIGAGGVGHTLTAARIGIQAEQAWTPGETQQMKKRLHRIGQDRPVDYYITVAEHTIDEQLWAVVTAKQATLDAVLDGRSDTATATDDKSVAAELTWRLTQQGLGTPPELATKLVEPDGATGTQPPAPIPLAPPRKPVTADDDTTSDDHGTSAADGGGTGIGGGARAVSGSRGGPATPMAAAKPGTCIVPGCGQPGRLYPAGTLCDTHRPATPVPPPQTCPGCGRAVPAHAPGCAERPTVLWPASDRPFGARDEITVRHWQEAHIDPDQVRAWCRDTGRDEPPAGGALPGDLAAAYLADRGAADIPMPGGPAHADWLAHRPALAESFTARLGPLTVVYGPCPRCGHPTAAEPGEPLPPCLDCASGSSGHDGPAGPPARLRPATQCAAHPVASAPASQARPASQSRTGTTMRFQRRHRSPASSSASPHTGTWRTACCRSRRGPRGRTAGAAARAEPTAPVRASIPARCTPAPARTTTHGSRWPAAPTLR